MGGWGQCLAPITRNVSLPSRCPSWLTYVHVDEKENRPHFVASGSIDKSRKKCSRDYNVLYKRRVPPVVDLVTSGHRGALGSSHQRHLTLLYLSISSPVTVGYIKTKITRSPKRHFFFCPRRVRSCAHPLPCTRILLSSAIALALFAGGPNHRVLTTSTRPGDLAVLDGSVLDALGRLDIVSRALPSLIVGGEAPRVHLAILGNGEARVCARRNKRGIDV